jgi:hypothetical protein
LLPWPPSLVCPHDLARRPLVQIGHQDFCLLAAPEKFEAKRCCSAPRCYVPHCIVSAFFLEPPPMRTRKLPLPDNALPPLERFLQQPKPARVCRRAPAVRDVVTGQRLPTVSATRPLTSSALRTWV